MPARDTDDSRTRTDGSLRAERAQSDEEVFERSDALAEDTERLIARARARAKALLAAARNREDEHQEDVDATNAVRAATREQRRVQDAVVLEEQTKEDVQRAQERAARRAAVVELFAGERQTTDAMLARERTIADDSIDAREDLLATVAHDLRSMLSTIILNASVVELTEERARAVRAAAEIQRAGVYMTRTLEDLLDVASFHAGQPTLVLSDIDIVQVVRDVVRLYEEIANSNRVVTRFEAHHDVLLVRADPRRVARMVMNVFSNALKYTPAGGRVDIAVSATAGECEVSVRDTGVGIAEDQLEAIFDRFRRARSEASRPYGVGLGLYITRLIAEAHGGRVWAESTPDHGSTFRIRLPLRGASS